MKLINPGSSGEFGWHSLETALVCPRKAALLRAKRAKASSDALARGELLHLGLAHLYARRKPGGADEFLPPLAAIDAFVEDHGDPLHVKWAERVKTALRAYRAFWGEEKHLEVAEVERVMRLTIEGKPYTQRVDLIWHNRNTGKWYVVDHKTTYAILPKVTRTYSLTGQMLGYQYMGRRAFKDKFGGVLLNYIKLNWTGEFEFGRAPVELAPLAVADLKRTILRAHRIMEEEVIGKTPEEAVPVFTSDACFGKYGACPGREFCKGERNG